LLKLQVSKWCWYPQSSDPPYSLSWTVCFFSEWARYYYEIQCCQGNDCVECCLLCRVLSPDMWRRVFW
jgi:hypothetical protein